jgi:DNA invertase Pin-like site-specific DNA recombinase
MTDIKPKAIGYIRVSSDEQAREGLSLEAQKRKINAYCELKDLELMQIFSDEAISGFKPFEKRPGGGKAYEILATGQADHLVAIKLDRLFRNTGDAISKATEFQKKNINLHLLDVSVDTSTATGKMFFTVLAMLAQFERDITGERTKAVLDMKRKDGKVFNHTPFGYDRDGDRLVDNPEEQKAIVAIMKMRNSGESYRDIASELELMGIKPKHSDTWQAMAVKKIYDRYSDSPNLF